MDVRVKRCDVRITRHGGWSWGMSRRQLAELAGQRLCELLLARMTESVELDESCHVSDPIYLKIRIGRRELVQWLKSPSTNRAMLSPTLLNRIDQAIQQSGIAEAIRQQQSNTQLEEPTKFASHEPSRTIALTHLGDTTSPLTNADTIEAASTLTTVRATTLLSFLLSLQQTGKLQPFLSRLAMPLISRWHEELLSEVGVTRATKDLKSQLSASPLASDPSSQIGSPLAESMDRRGQALLDQIDPILWSKLQLIARMSRSGSDSRTILVCRILVICEIADDDPKHLKSGMLVSILESLMPIDSGEISNADPQSESARDRVNRLTHGSSDKRRLLSRSTPGQFTPQDSAAINSAVSNDLEGDSFADHHASGKALGSQQPNARVSKLSAPLSPHQSRFSGETVCNSALPFLILGPLARTGYFDLLNVAMSAAKTTECLPAFAAALALKVSKEPKRGWLHDDDSKVCVCAMAGGLSELPSTEMQRLSERAELYCSALDTHLSGRLLDDDSECQIFHVAQVKTDEQSQVLLSDTKGHFPVALVDSFQQLDQLLLPFQDRTLLAISPSLLSPEWLSSCESSGLRFVIDRPPARGESWRQIPGKRGAKYWTNDTSSSPSRILQAGRCLETSTEASDLFWDVIASRRLAVPLAKDRVLEDSLSLAAGVSLSQIALDLWGEREETDPTLAIDRIGDLGCCVRFRSQSIQVALPMGKRSADLAKCGYMDDIANLPWLGGRTLTFSQG